MQLYRFSPIKNQTQLIEAIEYITKQATKLYFRSTGNIENQLISSLTIFAHYPDEYETLKKLAYEIGEPSGENNGPKVKLNNLIKVKVGKFDVNNELTDYHTSIQYLRIRKPDPYRAHVGCCDLDVDFHGMDFISTITLPNPDVSPRLITRQNYDMIEFHDPGIDVLAYVVSDAKVKQEHRS